MNGVASNNAWMVQRVRELAQLVEAQGGDPYHAGAETGREHDGVVLHAEDPKHCERQYTAVTAPHGPLAGRRVVRGREAGCRAWRPPKWSVIEAPGRTGGQVA